MIDFFEEMSRIPKDKDILLDLIVMSDLESEDLSDDDDDDDYDDDDDDMD